MRFLKKASIDNIGDFVREHNDFELYLRRDDITDINDSFEKLKKFLVKNKKRQYVVENKDYFEADEEFNNENIDQDICENIGDDIEQGIHIFAVHCPASKYPTSQDISGPMNYMSLCEVISDENEYKMFLEICILACKISMRTTDEVVVILHEGCQVNCIESPNFKCIYQELGVKFKTFTEKMQRDLPTEYKSSKIVIGIENLPPFTNDYKSGSPVCLEQNFDTLIENLHKINCDKPNFKFGAVIDFCHIIAECELNKTNNESFDKLFEDLLKSFEKIKEKIVLIHLSNYKNQIHGAVFENNEEKIVLSKIRDWCLENVENINITIEVSESEKLEGEIRFRRIMLEWCRTHTLLKKYLDENGESYKFLDALYNIFSYDRNTKMNDLYKKCFELRENVLKNGGKLFGFDKDTNKLYVNDLIIKAYIYYIRYTTLAFDLIEKYRKEGINLELEDFSNILIHYIFHDNLEICFNGIAGHYNVYWHKRKTMTLFHFDDGTEGNTKDNFDTLWLAAEACMKHISGGYETTNFISCSKYLGRCMLKYINFEKPNLTIYQVPVNCVLVDGKWVPLQQIEDFSKVENFVIDFSDFYNSRDSQEASFKYIYKKLTGKEFSCTTIGSIYDGEVIIKNKNGLESCSESWSFGGLEDVKLFLYFYKKYLDIGLDNANLLNVIKEIESAGEEDLLNCLEKNKFINAKEIEILRSVININGKDISDNLNEIKNDLKILCEIDIEIEKHNSPDATKSNFNEQSREDIYNQLRDFYKDGCPLETMNTEKEKLK